VSTDSKSVYKFAIIISVPACGIVNSKIIQPGTATISNNQFAFDTGSFYASGTFDLFTNPPKASGIDGLRNHYIGGCGPLNGQWNYTATWRNYSQSLLPTFLTQPGIANATPPAGANGTVIPIK
jgi:hypothetical protein